jgi:hypothetical protein
MRPTLFLLTLLLASLAAHAQQTTTTVRDRLWLFAAPVFQACEPTLATFFEQFDVVALAGTGAGALHQGSRAPELALELQHWRRTVDGLGRSPL